MNNYYRERIELIDYVKANLEERFQEILVPYLESELANYAGGDIDFRQAGKKFLVDGVLFLMFRGFEYLQHLLRNPGDWIDCRDLSPDFHQDEYEPALPDDVVRKLLKRQHDIEQELLDIHTCLPEENTTYDIERSELLIAEYQENEKILSRTTHDGRIKNIHNVRERRRQRVVKAIRRAIQVLWTHPDDWNLDVGPRARHLHQNVKTGALCRYSGNWRGWQLN
jgi:hypothetical protein